MRAVLCSLFIVLGSQIYADTVQLVPLHEEDAHFIHYRSLMIDGSVHRIEDILNESAIPEEVKEKILEEIKLIQFNLGYPYQESEK